MRLSIALLVLLSSIGTALVGYPETAEELADQGNTKRQEKKYDEALALLNRAIKLAPQYPRAYNYRAFVYEDTHDYQNARKDMEVAVSLSPTYCIFRNNLANILTELKKEEEAIVQYGEAIRLCPKGYLSPYFDRGKLHYKLGNYEGALQDFSKVASLRDSLDTVFDMDGWSVSPASYAQLFIGRVKLKMKDYKGAKEAFDRAIAGTPKFPHAYEERARARLAMGDDKGATNDLQTAQAIRKDENKFPELPTDLISPQRTNPVTNMHNGLPK